MRQFVPKKKWNFFCFVSILKIYIGKVEFGGYCVQMQSGNPPQPSPAAPSANPGDITAQTYQATYVAPDGSGNQVNTQIQYMSQGQPQYPMDMIPQPAAQPQPQKRRSTKGQSKPKVLPPELDIDGPTSNENYKAALSNAQMTVSPQALNFLPSNYWLNLDSSFGELVTKFFQRKNNANCRFPHKLYNALAIVEQDPDMYNLLGVKWITDKIFKVDKLLFGRVLGISAIDGGLFHQQGNFPSHGFFEIGAGDVSRYCPPGLDFTGVDFENVRLLTHAEKLFKRGCTEADIEHCRWANARK